MSGHVARWWTPTTDGRVRCTLCPRYCTLSDGQSGFCFVRQNQSGELLSLAYGRSTGFAVDPIEKKPLAHFLPGSRVLSFGTVGCNLGCKFCQNWSISKARLTSTESSAVTATEVVDLAKREGCASIACTYNDPVIFAEWMDTIGAEAGARGIRTVAVTAGYVTASARAEVFRHVDAVNVDLKAFSEHFYRKLALAHLQPVLDFLRWVRRETDLWLEVTTLVIPGWNDDPESLRAQFRWMRTALGAEVPLHLSAFYPTYKLREVPPTSPSTLRRARQLALDEGLRHVYTGNVHDPDGQTTRCGQCGEVLIRRDRYTILGGNLDGAGRCGACGAALAGVFESEVRRGDGRASGPRRVTLGIVEPEEER